MPAIWVGESAEKNQWGPYEGLLIIMNVGKTCPPVPVDYQDMLIDEVSQAHANGWLVVYVGDKGVSLPEDYLDYIEDFDHIRLMHDFCGRKEADFSILPDERAKELSAMAQHGFSRPHFSFQGTSARIVGRCKIGGKETLIPPTRCA